MKRWLLAWLLFAVSVSALSQAADLRKLEDAVASNILRIRANNKLKKLSRRSPKEELRQTTCSAVHGKPLAFSQFDDFVVYHADDPTRIVPELERMAKREEKNYGKFGVTVLSDNQGGYWVGVQYYLSGVNELFAYTMTDAGTLRKSWKRRIPPDCKDFK
jgi:hypothetical protein